MILIKIIIIEVTTINIIKETINIISFATKIILYFIFAFHTFKNMHVIMDANIKENLI